MQNRRPIWNSRDDFSLLQINAPVRRVQRWCSAEVFSRAGCGGRA
jgi:hypothetical protein